MRSRFQKYSYLSPFHFVQFLLKKEEDVSVFSIFSLTKILNTVKTETAPVRRDKDKSTMGLINDIPVYIIYSYTLHIMHIIATQST